MDSFPLFILGITIFLYITWITHKDLQEIKQYVKEQEKITKPRNISDPHIPSYVYPWWRHSYHNLWRPSSVYWSPNYGWYRSPFWIH